MVRVLPGWVPDAVFYQIFPDRFGRGAGAWPDEGAGATRQMCGGDLDGIRSSLPYIEELGANALYLTPIFTASSYHRYDTEDYFSVAPELGGNAALARLVDAARSRGMRIVLDGVFNHASHRHPHFADVVRRGRASQYWDWFRVHGTAVVERPEPNYDCWAGVPSMPEWNHANPEARAYLLSVVRHWIRECGIDGWRLDTTEYLPPDFVREIDRAAKAESPDTYILGEVMGLGTPWFRHDALDGVMHYKLYERMVSFIAEEGWDAARFAASVRSIWRSYTEAGNYGSMTLVGSHDKARFVTLCAGNAQKLLLATALVATFPGAPAIYYGDEIGMSGGEDPDNRRCFPWDEATWDRAVLERTRALLALRRRLPVLRTGSLTFVAAEGRAVVFRRELGRERALVALNADSKEGTSVSLRDGGPYVDALSGKALGASASLPPLGALVAYTGARA